VTSVVTVHGLWMRGASMIALKHRLEPLGMRVASFAYDSVRSSLADNAAALAAFIERTPGETVHLVGHSLGGVLIREALASSSLQRIGRVVCLGSPLRGSRTAARLARLPGGRFAIGKCLAEHNDRGGFSDWGTSAEVGGIAGRVPLGFGRLLGSFPEPNDGTVAVAETLIEGLRDHIVLPVAHMALLWSTQVAAQVEQFLMQGRFRR
jgi:pimeloyl-ACP methyl ester carboxylesterase